MPRILRYAIACETEKKGKYDFWFRLFAFLFSFHKIVYSFILLSFVILHAGWKTFPFLFLARAIWNYFLFLLLLSGQSIW